jgi:hypothetical protein
MAKKESSPPRRPPEALPIPVHCAGKGCERETVLLLPGKLSFRAGIWIETGWTVLNDPSDHSVVFLCSDCHAKGQASEQIREESTGLTAQREVSG